MAPMTKLGKGHGVVVVKDQLTEEETEAVTIVFHQFETGLREGTIYTKVETIISNKANKHGPFKTKFHLFYLILITWDFQKIFAKQIIQVMVKLDEN